MLSLQNPNSLKNEIQDESQDGFFFGTIKVTENCRSREGSPRSPLMWTDLDTPTDEKFMNFIRNILKFLKKKCCTCSMGDKKYCENICREYSIEVANNLTIFFKKLYLILNIKYNHESKSFLFSNNKIINLIDLVHIFNPKRVNDFMNLYIDSWVNKELFYCYFYEDTWVKKEILHCFSDSDNNSWLNEVD